MTTGLDRETRRLPTLGYVVPFILYDEASLATSAGFEGTP